VNLPSTAMVRVVVPIVLAVLVLSSALSCGRDVERSDKSRAIPAAGPDLDSRSTEPTTPAADRLSSRIDLLRELPSCEIDHYGLTIDVGSNAPRTDTAGAGSNSSDKTRFIDRSGATFAQVTARRFSQDFWLDEPLSSLRVSARVVGQAATALQLAVDGHPVGRQKLVRGDLVTVTFRSLPEVLQPGLHTLTLQALGRSPAGNAPFFDLDFIHLGRGEEIQGQFTPPTLRDVVADQDIDSVPRRSIVLRAPSSLRCPIHLGGSARLELSLGFWGTGTGVGEIRILEDGQAPTTLLERKVLGGQGAQWIPISLDLSAYAGRVVALELRAVKATEGGRIAFGEPHVTRLQPPPPNRIPGRTAVIVVLSRIPRRAIPPWGRIEDLSAFADLRRHAATYNLYRVPTGLPAATVASLLTGLPPEVHGLSDPSARLGRDHRLLSEIVKQSGGRTAMFTGVPVTFDAFGFNVGWDTFRTYSPVRDVPAETPLWDAARWLGEQLDQDPNRTRLLFVHLRGAHPPWDLTAEEVGRLPPSEYDGVLDPRRGGITIGRIRRQTTRSLKRLADDDWQRLSAFTQAALAKQSVALGQLLETLRRHEAWEDSLVIVAGDVGAGEPPNLPFDPNPPLREDVLLVPLLVKFPGRLASGASFDTPVTTVDLTRTILESLALSSPENPGGVDLWDLAVGRQPLLGRALVATSGSHYATRMGTWLLLGELGTSPKLCQIDVDPACVDNLFGTRPLAARSLLRWTEGAIHENLGRRDPSPREPAGIDPETGAALTVWGDIEQ
jgi:hypothetical protein